MIAFALLTFRELARRKFVLTALIATAVLIALTGWGFSYIAHSRHHGSVPTRMELAVVSANLVILLAYLFSFIVAMLAVFVAAPSLANDIESGVLLPVAARPISRASILGGRTLALGIVVCGYVALASMAEFLVVRAATGYFPPHPALAAGYLSLIALVMLSLATLAASKLPGIAAGIVCVVCFGLAWMGGIAQTLGTYFENDVITHFGTITQLLIPSDAMWRCAAYQLEPLALIERMSGEHVWSGPFFVANPPPAALVVWTLCWIAAIYAAASRSFALRDL
ncbi:MAG TPA: hypothetical protein VFL13_02155 [Candidatus Baltobacteraceae bacterium]|nr:hypothetical protein [Candidatus Baltobacteraceae bacterium]